MASKNKTRWGILSTAKIGVEKVIPAIQLGKLCDVTAIASRDLARAQSAANALGIQKVYGSYEALLADPEIDIIYNPLPNHLHVPYTLKALEAGKHVLCEKPIGLNTAEAELLERESAKYPNLKVMEAFMYRFHPQWHKTKEMVAAGNLGEVKTVHSFFSYYNDNPNNIRNKPDIGGGGLMDIGCYCISFPRFVFDSEPRCVVGMMENDPDMKVDRLTSAMLDFGNGKTATFTCSTQLVPYQRAVIVGTKARLEIEVPVNAYPLKPTRIWFVTSEKTEEIWFDVADQYQLQADAFALSVLNNTDVPTTLSDAANNMKVIDAIFKSAAIRAWVDVF